MYDRDIIIYRQMAAKIMQHNSIAESPYRSFLQYPYAVFYNIALQCLKIIVLCVSVQ